MERNEKYGKLVCTMWVLLISKNLISDNLTIVGKLNGPINLLVYSVIALYFSYTIGGMSKIFTINSKSVFIVVTVFLFCTIWIMVDPTRMGYNMIRDDLKNFILYSVPAILLISVMSNPGLILKYLYERATVLFVFLAVGFVLFFIGGGYNTAGVEYSMSYGNNAVLVCVLLLSKHNKTKKPMDLIFACLSLLAIIRIGSRFPILYIMTYITASIILKLKNTGRVFWAIVGSGIAVFVWKCWDSIIDYVIRIASGLNIQGRTISYLKWGMLSFDNGRNLIHQHLIKRLSDSPAFGYGFGGAVVALEGEGAHSFILDCLGNFGYSLGVPFIIITFLGIFIAWYKQRREDVGELFLVLGCCFFPTINIQTSLWGGYRFWWMIALSISYYTYSKNKYSYYKTIARG